jgi:PHS family inorganic phosphate transporter-like MFS transporter
MLLGFFATFLIPETKGISLEDLSNEDQTDFVKNQAKTKSEKNV